MRKSFPEAELAEALGSQPARWDAVVGGGYTRNTERWRVELADGRPVLVKVALDELAAGWLRDELRVYSAVEADFLPGFLAGMTERSPSSRSKIWLGRTGRRPGAPVTSTRLIAL